ncbi:GAF domain-containing protein, partial [bacterium]
MRGNIGFTSMALGQVRLTVGQGITGKAVEYLRPISAATAEQHAAYKHFEELGEERFPVFLAVPIRAKSGALGALVTQRAITAFDRHDVELLASLGALIAAGIRHAELLDTGREKAPRRAGGGTRKLTLPGRPLVKGRALGGIAALRRPPPRPSEHIPTKKAGDYDVKLLRNAFETAEREVRALEGKARMLALGHDAAFLGTYIEILADARFRQRATEIAATGVGLSHALSTVAREATRNAVAFTRDPYLEERMRDLEDLCDALTMLAITDKRAELPS